MRLLSLIVAVVMAAILASSSAQLRNKPTGLHIAFAGKDLSGNANKMAVSWNTVNQTLTSKVKYGTESGKYDKTALGEQSAYYETYNHHTITDDLIPGQTYYYIAGDDRDGWSSEHTFKGAATTSRRDFSFLNFADLGTHNGDWTINYITSIKDSVDLILHGGDVSYADDSYTHVGCFAYFCYEQALDEYLKLVEPWASTVPYMVAPGNHEANCHDAACLTDKERRIKLGNFSAYNGRYRMPSPECGGTLNMHYSFNYGSAHFVSLDTETGFPGAAEEEHYVGLPTGGFADQLTWLENDLKAANENRAQRPWVVAIGHHPMYQGVNVNKEFQAAIEDMFYKYGVDLYLSGHVHQYERNWPVYNSTVEQFDSSSQYDNPRATTHVVVGGSGNDEMKKAKRRLQEGDVPVVEKLSHEEWEEEGLSSWRKVTDGSSGPWTVVQDLDDHVGISKITIVDDSTLKFEYIRTHTLEVYDSFILKREHKVY